MQEINNSQLIQTYNQFITQLNQTINYNKERNTIEYKPNTLNTLDEELRKAENYYDWLLHYSEYTKQTIEKGNQFIESLLSHKEKIQNELIQQNKNLDEIKNKIKEIGIKIREIAKQEADEKIKKLEEERQKEWKRIVSCFT